MVNVPLPKRIWKWKEFASIGSKFFLFTAVSFPEGAWCVVMRTGKIWLNIPRKCHSHEVLPSLGTKSRRDAEPVHDKTYNKTCATSEDSDQPAHPRSLIRIFADRMCLLQPPGYPKWNKREPLPYWMGVHAVLSICWSDRSYCRYCHALAHMKTRTHGQRRTCNGLTA